MVRAAFVEIGGLVNKDSTRKGFVTSNLAATAREIEAWFFNDYGPTLGEGGHA